MKQNYFVLSRYKISKINIYIRIENKLIIDELEKQIEEIKQKGLEGDEQDRKWFQRARRPRTSTRTTNEQTSKSSLEQHQTIG